MNDLGKLYQDTIRRHAAQPVGHGEEIGATHRHELFNAQCGDRVEVKLRVAGVTIEAAAFDGEGCAICMASASLLCTHLPGERADALGEQLRRFTGALDAAGAGSNAGSDEETASGSGAGTDHEAACPPALRPLLPVAAWPARIACAILPWQTAVEALGDKVE